MEISIPVYRPSLSGNERKYVNDCLDSSWISSKGGYIQKFEEEFSKFVGVDFAVSTCNGTVALHLALVTLGVGPGDEVIVPTLTYIASVNSIAYTGATPVFVDSSASDWQMNPQDVRAKITPRTKAIMAVHLYGHSCDMDALKAIATEHGLFLVEDCAEAIGTYYKGAHVGTFGDISTFSFFGNKTITTGEGGMVVTKDPTLFSRALQFRGQGLAQYRQYWHDIIGYNYRMTNIAAAIGLAQLEQVHTFLQKKRQVVDWYLEFLSDKVETHREMPECRHSYWMFTILVSAMEKRDVLRNRLAEMGVETRPMFYPVHTMPMYSQRFMKHPVAEGLAWRGINLPSYPELTEEQVAYISDIINRNL
jgi:perosamine synthetase